VIWFFLTRLTLDLVGPPGTSPLLAAVEGKGATDMRNILSTFEIFAPITTSAFAATTRVTGNARYTVLDRGRVWSNFAGGLGAGYLFDNNISRNRRVFFIP